MKRTWPLLALAIGAYLVFAIATLPASVLVSRLQPLGINATGISGTVWKGGAQLLQVANANLGSLSWDLHGLQLLTAHLSADIKLARSDGFAQGELAISPSGRIAFRDLSASLPLSALPPNVVRGGYSGTVNLRLSELAIVKGWPVAIAGTIEGIDITGPARKPANMGSYKVIFPAPGTESSGETLTGAVTDLSGPLQVSGTLQLKSNRSYFIEGLLATRPEAPRDLVNSLQYLGAPDAQGRRPFSLEGSM